MREPHRWRAHHAADDYYSHPAATAAEADTPATNTYTTFYASATSYSPAHTTVQGWGTGGWTDAALA